MPKTISADLKLHLAQRYTTLATCVKITRTDGTKYGYTTHVRPLQGIPNPDLTTDSQLYKPHRGIAPTGVSSRTGLSVDNMEFTSILSDEAITEEMIEAGLMDYCEVELFVVNYNNLSQGKLVIKRGRIGEVTRSSNGMFRAELRGLSQNFQQEVRPLTSPTCRCPKLTEGRCGVDPEGTTVDGHPITATATVTSVESRRVLTISGLIGYPDDFYQYGVMTFVDGENAGVEREIKEFNSLTGELGLFEPAPFDIAGGDMVSLLAGCDRRIETCIEKFAAVIYFDGEPHVPGVENVARIIS